MTSAAVHIEPYHGRRVDVRWLFEIAEDSAANLDTYLGDGDVLLARLDGHAVGVLQITAVDEPDTVEVNLLAVAPDVQQRGIGRRLVDACFAEARRRGCTRVLVATGAADVGNLRFYQRCGFRMLRIERDAFTPAEGYPDPIWVHGVRLWDRVWFDYDLTKPPVTLA